MDCIPLSGKIFLEGLVEVDRRAAVQCSRLCGFQD